MHVQVKDKVRFVNEKGEGTVTRIEGKNVFVDVDGFEYPMPLHEIIVVDGDTTKVHTKVPDFDSLKSSFEVKVDVLVEVKRTLFDRKNHKGIPEIDLHTTSFLKNENKYQAHEIFEMQMELVKHAVREAFDKKLQRIVLIHGKGEGVLKSQIWSWLKAQNNIEFWDAPLKHYQGGATQVKLFLNGKTK
jgi:dsDNA-specific endonuclease/ATPase MutS2